MAILEWLQARSGMAFAETFVLMMMIVMGLTSVFLWLLMALLKESLFIVRKEPSFDMSVTELAEVVPPDPDITTELVDSTEDKPVRIVYKGVDLMPLANLTPKAQHTWLRQNKLSRSSSASMKIVQFFEEKLREVYKEQA